ncbi:MAG: LL-diaminopimelate aminotransferase [Chloroflexota bacterium]
MRMSRRVNNLPPYLFVEISRKIAEKKARGEDVISFGIGDPDIPTPSHVIERLCQAAHDPANHRYPESDGLAELREAIARWYAKRFDVRLNPGKEVAPLIGAKEGLAHMSFCLIDAGDVALITDPAYPVYSISTRLAGGEPYYLPLTRENKFLPDLASIPHDILNRTRVLWLNYPNNPTGAVADLAFFNRAAAFAKKHNIIICHDAPYTEVAYDGYRPVSFLQAEGAMDVGIEFHSFSKSYNMTGWRIGMALGNPELIGALKKIKSNMDSGIPLAIQHAAIAALEGPQDCIEAHNKVYQRRRDVVIETLHKLGIEADVPKASLYVWAKVPEGYSSGSFATELLEDLNIVVTPGAGYGKSGEGYVRISLTLSDADLDRGMARLAEWRAGKSKAPAKK